MSVIGDKADIACRMTSAVNFFFSLTCNLIFGPFLIDSQKRGAYSQICSRELEQINVRKMGSYPSRSAAVIVTARRAFNRHNRIDLGGARRESKARP
jgi:hypothetical protein